MDILNVLLTIAWSLLIVGAPGFVIALDLYWLPRWLCAYRKWRTMGQRYPFYQIFIDFAYLFWGLSMLCLLLTLIWLNVTVNQWLLLVIYFLTAALPAKARLYTLQAKMERMSNLEE